MKQAFLIDRFSEPLTEKDAEKYFSRFVCFDENDVLVEPNCESILEFEIVMMKLFSSFFEGRIDLLEIKLEQTLSFYLDEKNWIKDSLRTSEFIEFKEYARTIFEKQIRGINTDLLKFFVMIGCRELFFPSFEFPGISITPCDDNAFLVTYENEILAQELKGLIQELGLHHR